MVPSFRKILALEVADGGSPTAAAAESFTFLSGCKKNCRANASSKRALPGSQAADDHACKSLDDL
jgi:hypothetical protein